MKKIFLLLGLAILFIACSSEESKIIEVEITSEKINFSEEEFKDGRFILLFRNFENESIPISLLSVNHPIMEDAQKKDFCEGVLALRNGKSIAEWTPINFNIPIVPESQVENQNDHPNLVSYNLPVGTYMLLLMDENLCDRDNHKIFDVKRNKNFEGN